MKCLRIYESADPHTWDDNYLCWIQRPGWQDPNIKWRSAGILIHVYVHFYTGSQNGNWQKYGLTHIFTKSILDSG